MPAAAIAFVALFLVEADARAAQQVTPLASTPQYQGFVQYIAELRENAGEPATATQKANFESRLSNKYRATVNRANTLFQRAKAIAKNETQKSFKRGATALRRDEAAELARMRELYGEKLDLAADRYQDVSGALQDKFDARQVVIQRQLRKLRMDKAKADGLARKESIQREIDVIVKELSDSRRAERRELNSLRDRFQQQKRAIQAAKSTASARIQQANDDALDALRKRWNRTFNARAASLQANRTRQLADLEAKLARGRAAIASMPAAS